MSTKRIPLTPDGRSWVDVSVGGIPIHDAFPRLLAIKPAERGSVKVFNKERTVPRTQSVYGRPYFFSGMDHPARPMEPVVQDFLEYANGLSYERPRGVNFNQVVANWYVGGSEYISPHSDDERQLCVDDAGETIVVGASWGATRTLRMRRKRGVDGVDIDIDLKDGMLYVMGGTTQRTHTHAIPKCAAHGTRISLTARCFRD